MQAIRRVVIYTGHAGVGPYAENIPKRVEMFGKLNPYRMREGMKPWTIRQVNGETLLPFLKERNPRETLLVLPAGQSSHYDRVFSLDDLQWLRERFFAEGGVGYLNCGSAYWASRRRLYWDVCSASPIKRRLLDKKAAVPFFEGVSMGPLCPYPAAEYQVGFFSDAVRVKGKTGKCTVLLSGGGAFFPDAGSSIVPLAHYAPTELARLGKPAELSLAALATKIGQGKLLLTMFHPYYGARDLDAERYERAFPGSGTNWRRICEKLSPEEERLRFVWEQLLKPLAH